MKMVDIIVAAEAGIPLLKSRWANWAEYGAYKVVVLEPTRYEKPHRDAPVSECVPNPKGRYFKVQHQTQSQIVRFTYFTHLKGLWSECEPVLQKIQEQRDAAFDSEQQKIRQINRQRGLELVDLFETNGLEVFPNPDGDAVLKIPYHVVEHIGVLLGWIKPVAEDFATPEWYERVATFFDQERTALGEEIAALCREIAELIRQMRKTNMALRETSDHKEQERLYKEANSIHKSLRKATERVRPYSYAIRHKIGEA